MPFQARDIRVETKRFSLRDFLSMMTSREICFRKNYQNETWSSGSQSRFMESLLLGLPAGTFCVDASRDGIWHIIDGCQRIEALIGFIAGGWHLSGLNLLEEMTGMAFTDLPGGMRRMIEETPIICYLIMPGTPEEAMSHIFFRMNPQRF